MSCYHPKKAFEIGINPETGKRIMKICGFNTVFCTHLETFKPVYEYTLVPCGNCIGCKLDYAKQWAIRCMLESSFYQSNYFITLTYDEEHNTRNLIKEDLQKFIKKLRTYLSRENKPEIRFFGSGEYGTTTMRPHFHVIIFNLVLEDLKLYKRTPNGDTLYTSEFINNIWQKGYAIIGEVTFQSCGYVARYCMKKFKANDMKDFGFNNEFVLMSRRPGIGYGYFLENKDNIYKYDAIYKKFGELAEATPPKYFDRKMEELDPELLQNVKNMRKLKAEMRSLNSLLNTSFLDEEKYLEKCEEDKIIKTKILKRSKI